MTKQQLEAVIDALVEIVDCWNDAEGDEDRGRGDIAICLTIWDDGSGRIGRRRSLGTHVEDFHDFDDIRGLAKVLREDEYVEIDE